MTEKFDNKKEYKNIAERLINRLENDDINVNEWNKGFIGFHNPTTNKEYTGKNTIVLMLSQMFSNYSDNRYLTFNQIKKLGLKLKKGSKGTCLNYVNTYRKDLKRNLTLEEINDIDLISELESKGLLQSYKKYFTVFNGDDVEGLEEIKDIKVEITNDIDINTIANSIGVSVKNQAINTAHYNLDDDCIYLPKLSQLTSSYEHYLKTFFHELTHATGHKSRLDRNLGNYGLDSDLHSTEELIAELGSIILAKYFNVNVDEKLYNNSLIYIKGWLSLIEDDKKVEMMAAAIEQAIQAATLIISKSKIKKAA
ncbi:MAG: zincin-like metallopeptidase domain-containing protein [Finegoldia magna]|nr:zincin-like metallopeptidase domain-containing protein [Finegoldia magna]MDU2897395.1 zincin-like metallopeptidase domain-containing protein [Finegoldia magna]